MHNTIEHAEQEIWKPISCFPGYSVSNKGRVKSDETDQIMVLSHNGGYPRFTVTRYVHRLVAEAFIEKPEDERKLVVDHIDGNKSNNDVSNLRWVTYSDNTLAFGYESRRKSKRRRVIATNLNGEKIIFESRQAAAEYFGCSDSEIIYGKRYKKRRKRGWIFEKERI